MEQKLIGKAFEDLKEEEMEAVQGAASGKGVDCGMFTLFNCVTPIQMTTTITITA